ncbi:MAG: tyrosine-protein phosphatase [Acidimicrobiales bacterium]
MGVERRLCWPDCAKVRDLGGLRTGHGRTTRRRAVVRSDSLDRLTPAGFGGRGAGGHRRRLRPQRPLPAPARRRQAAGKPVARERAPAASSRTIWPPSAGGGGRRPTGRRCWAPWPLSTWPPTSAPPASRAATSAPFVPGCCEPLVRPRRQGRRRPRPRAHPGSVTKSIRASTAPTSGGSRSA